MKKFLSLFYLALLSSLLITGCANNDTASSSYMVRSSGLGETALPLEHEEFAFEIFNDKATSIDIISVNRITDRPEDYENYYITSEKVSNRDRYYGINCRFGLWNYTEIKLGLFQGSIFEIGRHLDIIDESGNQLDLYQERYTQFHGLHLGLKHLLTHYTNPHKVSLFIEGKQIITDTHGYASRYDGKNLEFKSALIYGYLKDTSSRNFPSIGVYHSIGNTKRQNSVEGIDAQKQTQAIGSEVNLNLAYGMVYANISTGLEKEIGHKTSNEIKPYWGIKFGVHFKKPDK